MILDWLFCAFMIASVVLQFWLRREADRLTLISRKLRDEALRIVSDYHREMDDIEESQRLVNEKADRIADAFERGQQ